MVHLFYSIFICYAQKTITLMYTNNKGLSNTPMYEFLYFWNLENLWPDALPNVHLYLCRHCKIYGNKYV